MVFPSQSTGGVDEDAWKGSGLPLQPPRSCLLRKGRQSKRSQQIPGDFGLGSISATTSLVTWAGHLLNHPGLWALSS